MNDSSATPAGRWHRTVAGYFRTGTEDGADPATFDLEDRKAWDGFLRALDGIEVTAVGNRPVPAIEQMYFNTATINQALSRPAVADHIAERLLALEPADWAVAATVADIIKAASQGRPAGKTIAS